MNFAKIENGVVVDYPIPTFRMREIAGVEFNDQDLSTLPEGYVAVYPSTYPALDYSQRAIERSPVLKDGAYYQNWEIVANTGYETSAMPPSITMMALSNVYCRMMHFKGAGDYENGHKHAYHHATLVSSGSVNFQVLDDDKNVISEKTFVAPSMVFVDKDKLHKIVALEANTVCVCVHALRTVDGELIPPDAFIEPITSAIPNAVLNATGMPMDRIIKPVL